MGFEPMQNKLCELESHALTNSATLTWDASTKGHKQSVIFDKAKIETFRIRNVSKKTPRV